MTDTPAFSVLVLSLNEEKTLPACLASVAGLDDVVVLDSGSSDGTEAVARAAGARFLSRPFDDFAGQRNAGLERAGFRRDWVFHLDADERMTPALIAECDAIARGARPGGSAAPEAWHVASKTLLRGKWIRRSTCYPAYQMRFHRLGAVRFVQHGHGQREAPGTVVGRLREPLVHDAFAKGMADWIERHNRYSTDEARLILRERAERAAPGEILSRDPVARRRALKRLASRFPVRAPLKFLYLYAVRGGFLDGREGLTYCSLQALYEYMIEVKVREALDDRSRAPDA